MKTAGRENPNHHRAILPRNRAHGAVGQNRSRSIKWAAKQEKLQPKEMCFFLTSPFIELTIQVEFVGENGDFSKEGNPAAHWAIRSTSEAAGYSVG